MFVAGKKDRKLMMRKGLPIRALMVLSIGLALRAQPPDERKAKNAAEAMELGSSPRVAGVATTADQADHQRKRAAEAMYAVATAVGGTNRLVTDKPFSGEAVTETVQTLADGNRVVRHNATKYFRDRSGRTRREQTIEALGPSSTAARMRIIVISDPVIKTDYILDPVHETIRRFGRLETHPPDAKLAVAPGGVRKENLGVRKIEGLECIGTRDTITLPAGQVGNERPIVTVTETWYSRTIEAVVRSTTSDPRFGDVSYTLTVVTTTEQPLSLFEPPPSYKVEFAGKPGVTMKRLERP